MLTGGGSAWLNERSVPRPTYFPLYNNDHPHPDHQSCFLGNGGVSGLRRGEAPIGPGLPEEQGSKTWPTCCTPSEPHPQVSI